MNSDDWSPYADAPNRAPEMARYVIYPYTMSFLLVTLKRGSEVVRIAPGESRLLRGLPYLFLTLTLGWWGFPWGPIYTLESIAKILGGGIDVTEEVYAQAFRQSLY